MNTFTTLASLFFTFPTEKTTHGKQRYQRDLPIRFVLCFTKWLGFVLCGASEAQSNRTKHKETHHMSTYESLLTASIAYIRKHGKTRKTLDNLESLLPACWAAELIADALDSI